MTNLEKQACPPRRKMRDAKTTLPEFSNSKVIDRKSGLHHPAVLLNCLTVHSRKKIHDKFSGLLKKDGTPMSRQQVHMLRKHAKKICLTCNQPAIGVYCAKHTLQARERMRNRPAVKKTSLPS